MKKRFMAMLLCLCMAALLPATALADGTDAKQSGTVVGDFVVEGGVLDTDYAYEGNVLTIKTNEAVAIGMREGVTQTATDRVAVAAGVKARITLKGVRIDVSDTGGSCAFRIDSGSEEQLHTTVALTLEGDNILKSGEGCGGLQNSRYASLAISGGGSLKATGGKYGAGIGGGENSNAVTAHGGEILITGGHITAQGGSYAAGIGDGDYPGTVYATTGASVTITGGIVTAKGWRSGSADDIGRGDDYTSGSAFSTGAGGSAVIYANEITDMNTTADVKKQDAWNGLFFESNTGVVCGNVTLTEDLTITSGQKLTIPYGRSLTIQDGVTLTNYGSITNNGTLTNGGSIDGTGAIAGVGAFTGVPGMTGGSADNIYKDARGNKIYVPDGCFAARVVSFTPGDPWTDDYLDTYPNEILGAPDRGENTNGMAVTLGTDGEVVLEFDREIVDGDGTDIHVFEVGAKVESVKVAISANMTDWYDCGSTSNSQRGVDIASSGAPSGCKYVRLTDNRSVMTGDYPGADVDAVAVNMAFSTPAVTLNQDPAIFAAREGGEFELSLNVSGIVSGSNVTYTITETDANGILTLAGRVSGALSNSAAFSLGSFAIAKNLDGHPPKTATLHIEFDGDPNYKGPPAAIDVTFYLAPGRPLPVAGDHYYTITAAAGAGGGISPSGPVSVRAGMDKTFTITPDEGYVIGEVLLDGVSVKSELTDGSYTIKGVDRGHSINVTFAEESQDLPFTDVREGDWFFEDVRFAYESGHIFGTTENTFSPNGTATRGMIVSILYRMEGSPSIEDEIWGYPFADVDAEAYYGTAVYWARLTHIIDGYDAERFGPNDAVTREQLAAILYRYARYKGYDTSASMEISGFDDADNVGSYAVPALKWACGSGLIQGSGGKLAPQGRAERCQVAAILHRLCESLVK